METKKLVKYFIITFVVLGVIGFAIQTYRVAQVVSDIKQSVETPQK